jgi:hypothetical protein
MECIQVVERTGDPYKAIMVDPLLMSREGSLGRGLSTAQPQHSQHGTIKRCKQYSVTASIAEGDWLKTLAPYGHADCSTRNYVRCGWDADGGWRITVWHPGRSTRGALLSGGRLNNGNTHTYVQASYRHKEATGMEEARAQRGDLPTSSGDGMLYRLRKVLGDLGQGAAHIHGKGGG